jgi:porin
VSLDYDSLLSAGLNVNGALWGRAQDELGLGYAYLEGEDHSHIDHSLALEAYVRFQLTRHMDLSLDLQYLEDDDHELNRDPRAWIPGLRINTIF